MMDETKQSNASILAMKRANKGGKTLGGAGGAKGCNQGEFGSPKHAPDAETKVA